MTAISKNKYMDKFPVEKYNNPIYTTKAQNPKI